MDLIFTSLAYLAKAIGRLESKDGQEPTAESRKCQPENRPMDQPPLKEDRAAISHRGAALDREFWETQS